MIAFIKIQLTPEAVAVVQSFHTLPARMLDKMRGAMDQANELVIGRMSVSRFTGRGPFPVSEHRLGVRTNRLRSSIRRNDAQIVGQSVQGAIGSNVTYAGVHEFGSTASGIATVRPFTRRKAVKEYRVPLGGSRGRLVKVTAGDGTVTVRAHSRRWKHNIPARAPFRTGIEENAGIYTDLLSKAVIESMKENG